MNNNSFSGREFDRAVEIMRQRNEFPKGIEAGINQMVAEQGISEGEALRQQVEWARGNAAAPQGQDTSFQFNAIERDLISRTNEAIQEYWNSPDYERDLSSLTDEPDTMSDEAEFMTDEADMSDEADFD